VFASPEEIHEGGIAAVVDRWILHAKIKPGFIYSSANHQVKNEDGVE
jgi:hypothetical protein